MNMRYKERSEGRFWKIYSIVFAALGLCLVLALLWFRFWLKDYENNERHHVAERAVSLLQDGYYEAIARRTDVVTVGLEPVDKYTEAITKAFAGKKITYSKAFSYDRFEKPIYSIEADGEQVCKVVLKKSGAKSRFGFDMYMIDYFTEFSFEDTPELSFWLPSFVTPYVNGQALTDVFVQRDGQNTDLFGYAVTKGKHPAMRMYTVKGLLADAEIRCLDEWGNEAEVTEKDGVFEAHFSSRIFHVPENVRVFVNGVLLGEEHRVQNAENTEDISGVPLLTGSVDLSQFVTYRADYLAGEPRIELKDPEGQDVSYIYNASTGTITVGFTVYTIYAPKGLQTFAGGVEISAVDTWRTQSDLAVEDLSTILEKYLPQRPVMEEYRVAVLDTGGFTVEVVNFLGQRVSVPLDPESLTYTYTFALGEGAEEAAAYTELALERSKMYSKYVASDLSWDAFMGQILRDQSMYEELRSHPQGFYTGHARYWFENEAVDNLQVYSEDCFSCEVSYDHYIADIKTDHNFVTNLETHVRFWFVRYEGQWYMAEWGLL